MSQLVKPLSRAVTDELVRRQREGIPPKIEAVFKTVLQGPCLGQANSLISQQPMLCNLACCASRAGVTLYQLSSWQNPPMHTIQHILHIQLDPPSLPAPQPLLTQPPQCESPRSCLLLGASICSRLSKSSPVFHFQRL